MLFQVLLLYDIENDRIRGKVSNACLDYGLDRIQYSAFSGRLSRNHQEELMMQIEAFLDDGKAAVTLVRIGDRDWDNRLELQYVG
ncbi:MAG: CRISPR-associated endonuclease Cas2 [Chloroflexi bacterium]|nr:CRISPR-associated endonuclease Cas2 [Chloroflexota bacterium]